MENKEKDIFKKTLNHNKSNEKLRKFVENFFETGELYNTKAKQVIKENYKEEANTFIEKYYCEEKYIDLVYCLSKTEFQSMRRCEPVLEDLGKCLFERMRIEEMKNQN